MNLARHDATRLATGYLVVAVVVGAILCQAAPASAIGLKDLPQFGRKLGEKKKRIDDAKAKAEAKLREAHEKVVAPLQRTQNAITEAESLKAGIEQTIGAVKEGGDLAQLLPSGVPAVGVATGGVEASVEEPGYESALEIAGSDLASLDRQWQQSVGQATAVYCKQLGRRPKETQELFEFRVRSTVSLARVAVEELLAKSSELVVEVNGDAIQLGSHVLGSGSNPGSISFRLSIEDQAAAPRFHLLDPAVRSLASFVASGPSDGDHRVLLRGKLACSASGASRLRASSNLGVRVVFSRSSFASGDQAATDCASLAHVALAPIDVQIFENGERVKGVTMSFTGK